jgi:predicted glycosyltransferase
MGHQIKVAAIKKEITYELLDAYKISYEKIGENKPGPLLTKIPLLISSEFKLHEIASQFKPDIFVSSYSPISALVSRLHKKKHLAFHDTENTRLTDLITEPFTDIICTPACFLKNYGEKQIRFEGYKELCYLDPKYFTPDPNILRKIGAKVGDPLIFLRLASFSSHHDISQHGIRRPLELITRLERYGKIILSTEIKDPILRKYECKIPPEDIHSLMYYSSIYVGDSATMATEAGLLGTPSIYVSTFQGTLGNFIELEKKYKLVYSYREESEANDKIYEIIQNDNSKKIWEKRRDVMLKEKIDVNEFLFNQIINAV